MGLLRVWGRPPFVIVARPLRLTQGEWRVKLWFKDRWCPKVALLKNDVSRSAWILTSEFARDYPGKQIVAFFTAAAFVRRCVSVFVKHLDHAIGELITTDVFRALYRCPNFARDLGTARESRSHASILSSWCEVARRYLTLDWSHCLHGPTHGAPIGEIGAKVRVCDARR